MPAATSYHANTSSIIEYGHYLGTVAEVSLNQIRTHATMFGMSNAGFGDLPSLMAPLGDYISGDGADLVNEAFNFMSSKLTALGQAVIDTANDYQQTDDQNVSLSAAINSGSGPGTPSDLVLQHSTPQGTGKFKIPSLSLVCEQVPNANFSDQIGGGAAGATLQVLDFAWEQVDPGKTFTGSVIEPLAGNPQAIRANAKAWSDATGALAEVAINMGSNLLAIGGERWGGTAYTAFELFFQTYWKQGAVWAAEKTGEFIGKGYDKIAEVSERIAKVAIEAIKKIIKLASKSALRMIPVGGWIFSAGEGAYSLIAKIFGNDDVDNLVKDIYEIVELGKTVMNLFDAMEQVISSMKDYFVAVQGLVDFITSIPDPASMDTDSASDQINDLKNKQESMTDAFGDASTALDEVEEAVNDVDD